MTLLAWVKANPPDTKNFSLSPAVCVTVTIPGCNCEITGECPTVIAYSPDSPGIPTWATTYFFIDK